MPNVKRKKEGTQLIWRIAALLALVAGMGWLSLRLQFMGKDHLAARLVTLTTNEQQISKTLPDGTRILLNVHSTLSFPVTLANEDRTVTLMGEASFDVAPDASRSFRVEARTCVIEGEGTSFTVQTYDAKVHVAVLTGKVHFFNGRKALILTKNQQATF